MSRMILTDVGNILTRFKKLSDVAKEIMTAFSVSNINTAEIFEAATGLDPGNERYYEGLALGQFNVQKVWRRLTQSHGVSSVKCPYPLFLSLWCKHLEPIKDVVSLYLQLQRQFPLVAVSNGDSEGVRHILYHLIGTHGLKFEEIFVSAERKRKKPELFTDVIEFLHQQNVSLSECVFVDDIEAYVNAAKKLGIPAIQFDGSKEPATVLQTALHCLGFS